MQNLLSEVPALAQAKQLPVEGNGLALVLSVVCSCIQNVRYPGIKLTGLELMLRLGMFL